jgi:hypothetical protein
MRIESSVTSLSWIPKGGVEGFNRRFFLLFGRRVKHHDPPPPEVLGDLDELELGYGQRLTSSALQS